MSKRTIHGGTLDSAAPLAVEPAANDRCDSAAKRYAQTARHVTDQPGRLHPLARTIPNPPAMSITISTNPAARPRGVQGPKFNVRWAGREGDSSRRSVPQPEAPAEPPYVQHSCFKVADLPRGPGNPKPTASNLSCPAPRGCPPAHRRSHHRANPSLISRQSEQQYSWRSPRKFGRRGLKSLCGDAAPYWGVCSF